MSVRYTSSPEHTAGVFGEVSSAIKLEWQQHRSGSSGELESSLSAPPQLLEVDGDVAGPDQASI
mgnify:CR=1 FL=1